MVSNLEPIYLKDKRWDVKFAFVLFIFSFFLMLYLWLSIVREDIFKILAMGSISLQ